MTPPRGRYRCTSDQRSDGATMPHSIRRPTSGSAGLRCSTLEVVDAVDSELRGPRQLAAEASHYFAAHTSGMN